MRELTEKADDAKVPCWVQSSHGAWKTFQKRGFVERGRLQLDLDEWCVGPDGVTQDGEWGEYVWRYMERVPRGR